MSYQVHNFQSGDVLYASQLNDMDNQIAENDAGKIDKPSNPSNGAFLVWNGSAWVAQTGDDVRNYNQLTNKPRINGVELIGNKLSSDLGIANLFIAEYGVTTNGEIEGAYQAGKTIVCVKDYYLYSMISRQEGWGGFDVTFQFGLAFPHSYVRLVCDYNDQWDEATSSVYSSSNPVMDGTASTGSSYTYARSDHVHPTDTSRIAVNQGVANAGKPLIVGNNGMVAPGDITKPLIVRFTVNGSTVTTSTTLAEILAAIKAGREVIGEDYQGESEVESEPYVLLHNTMLDMVSYAATSTTLLQVFFQRFVKYVSPSHTMDYTCIYYDGMALSPGWYKQTATYSLSPVSI